MGFVKKDSLFLALSVFSPSAIAFASSFYVTTYDGPIDRPPPSPPAHALRHTRFLTLLERDGNGGGYDDYFSTQ